MYLPILDLQNSEKCRMKFKCGWWCTLSLKYTHIAWYGMHPGISVGFQNWGGVGWGAFSNKNMSNFPNRFLTY